MRIHRGTLTRLRKSIQPITPAQLMRWLFNWQHVTPGTQLKGEQGLLEIIRQLQGFEIAANAWEKQILAKRIADYQPDMLDRLCLTGIIGWGRLSPHPAFSSENQMSMKNEADANKITDNTQSSRRIIPTSVAPITFFVRAEMDWISSKHGSEQERFKETDRDKLSPVAKNIYTLLQQRGACFFADIVHGTGRLPAEVENGLWELVAAGLATADGFDNLRALINPRRRSGQGRQRFAKPRHSAGRWSLLYTDMLHTNTDVIVDRAHYDDSACHLEAVCWRLLKRYGIVFRDILARETLLPRWRELLITFRRLEDRGEIRGGRFVDGFLGEQFALPYAVESLRALKKQEPNNQLVEIAAVDPLNLAGIILPGNRLPAISGKMVRFRDGIPLISI